MVEDPAGEELLAATFSHDEHGVSALCAALARFDVDGVAIEPLDGLLLVYRLLKAGRRAGHHLRFVAIPPLSSELLLTAESGSKPPARNIGKARRPSAGRRRLALSPEAGTA